MTAGIKVDSEKLPDLFSSLSVGSLILIFVVLIAYFPAFFAGFIWDDTLVTDNLQLRSMDGLWKIWTDPSSKSTHDPRYWPMMYTIFWLEHHLWNNSPFGYHLVNILIHAMNSILAWILLRRLKIPGAWFGAAIFAVHPVHVEAVAWIIELKSVLSCLFFLGSFLFYMDFEERKHRGKYIISVVLFILALLSKPVTVGFPLIIILWLWWKKEQLRIQDILPTIPLFISAGLITLITILMGLEKDLSEIQLSGLERILIAGRAICFYVGKLIIPMNLMAIYPKWDINIYIGWQYLFPLAVIIVLCLLWYIRNRVSKAPLVAVLFFVIMLIPTLGFIKFGYLLNSYVADRYQYLSSLGLIALFTVIIQLLFIKYIGYKPRIMMVVFTILIVGLIWLTWQQAKLYKNMGTLFGQNIALNPQSWSAHYNLGLYFEEMKQNDKAYEHYSIALKHRPNFPEAMNRMGVILMDKGKLDEAKEIISKVLQQKPDYAEVYNNMGIILAKEGKTDEAQYNFNKALQLSPDYADAYYNLGNIYTRQGKLKEAVEQYREALRIKPKSAIIYNNLGIVLARQGNYQEAIDQFNKAIRIQPDYTPAKNNLKNVLDLINQQKDTEKSD